MENNNVFVEAVSGGGDDTIAKKGQKTTGQDVQSTNSDATKPSADNVKRFLKILDKQAQGDRDIDKEICKIIDRWSNKPTQEAKRLYEKKGYSRSQYIGRKLSQAGVPCEKGLAFLKARYPDMDQKKLEAEYKKGYGEISFDEKFRDYFTKPRKQK